MMNWITRSAATMLFAFGAAGDRSRGIDVRRMLFALAAVSTAGACASPPGPASAQKVEIVRNSGFKQCDEQTPSPQTFAKLLEANGVAVLSSACASDGAMRAQMCGMDRGLFYLYEVDRSALAKALSLGYTQANDAQSALRFKRVPCV